MMRVNCGYCGAEFRVDQDEDGYAEVPGEYCADPECGNRLCPVCLDHFAFACDGCGLTFCSDHQVLVPDGTDKPLRLCKGCALEADVWPEIAKLEPLVVTVVRPNIPEWNPKEAA